MRSETNMVKQMLSTVEMRLQEAEILISKFCKAGITNHEAQAWLAEAWSALEAGRIELAYQKADQVMSSAQLLKDAKNATRRHLELAEAEFARAEGCGVDSADAVLLLREAQAAEREERFSESSILVGKALSALAEAASPAASGIHPPAPPDRFAERPIAEFDLLRSDLESFRVELDGEETILLAQGRKEVQSLTEAGRYAEAEAATRKYEVQRYLTTFQFPHMLEMELMVVNTDGHSPPMKRAEELIGRSVHEGLNHLRSLIANSNAVGIPRIIRDKIRRLSIENWEGNILSGEILTIEYQVDERSIPVNLIRRNRGAGTFSPVLGITTPPCRYAEELEWWAHALYSIVYDYVTIEGDCAIILSGSNPTEPTPQGLSFGDYHQILILDPVERAKVAEMMMGHAPELVAISVNSPVQNSMVPGIAINPDGVVIVKGSHAPFSSRLKSANLRARRPEWGRTKRPGDSPASTAGAGGFPEKKPSEPSNNEYVQEVQSFSELDTIRINLFDAQLSIRARIGIAVILQAMASEAVCGRNGEWSVRPADDGNLSINIDRAVLRGGLLPLERAGDGSGNDDLHESERSIAVSGGLHPSSPLLLAEGCRNLIIDLKDRFLGLRCHQRGWMDAFLCSLWGGTKRLASPPMSPAQYQLWVLVQSEGNIQPLITHLMTISARVRQDPAFDPIIDIFGRPCFLKNDWSAGPGQVAASQDLDPLSLLENRIRLFSDKSIEVPVSTQVALQVARSFHGTDNRVAAGKFALWGLQEMAASRKTARSQGGRDST